MYDKLNRLLNERSDTDKKVKEVTLMRSLIVGYVKQLFRRFDFPQEILVALDNCVNASKGDVVFASNDCEDTYGFIPMPRIDDLITNIPTKEEFLSKLNAESMEDVSREDEDEFWKKYEFQFAEFVQGVKLIWK
jgi:hypothetical protein